MAVAPGSAAVDQQPGAASTEAAVSLQATSNAQASQRVNTPENYDVEMVDAPGPMPSEQLLPRDPLPEEEADPNDIAIVNFCNNPPPAVLLFNPELAASSAELMARCNLLLPNVLDRDSGSSVPRQHARAHFEDDDEMDEDVAGEEDSRTFMTAGRGPRTRVNKDEEDEYKPGRVNVRKSRAAPSTPRVTTATTTGANKRARDEATSNSPTPKRVRTALPSRQTRQPSVGEATARNKRSVGRPRKRPLPNSSQSPAGPVVAPVAPSIATGMHVVQSTSQSAIPQPVNPRPVNPQQAVPQQTVLQPTVLQQTVPRLTVSQPTVSQSSLVITSEAPVSAPAVWANAGSHAEQMAPSGLSVPSSDRGLSGEPTPSLGSAQSDEFNPQQMNPLHPKQSDADEGEEDYQPESKTAKRKRPEPKLDEKGNPIKRPRAPPKLDEDGNPIRRPRAPLKVDENGQPIQRARGRPVQVDENGKRIRRNKGPSRFDEHGKLIVDVHARIEAGDNNCWADPSAKMRSSEGEEMTRGELGLRFKSDQRKYHPGGIGGGRYEILATGVIWSFVSETRKPLVRKKKLADTTAASGEGSSQETTVPNSQQSVPADSQGEQDANTTTQATFQPIEPNNDLNEEEARALVEELTLALAQIPSPQTNPEPPATPGIHRPNAPSHISFPLSAIGPPATTIPTNMTAPPTTSTTPIRPRIRILVRQSLPSYDPATSVAARVAQLDERCALYHVQTRDRFGSDAAFLAYAEGMLELLYPRMRAAPALPPAAPGPRGGGHGGGGGLGGFGGGGFGEPEGFV